MSGFLKIFGGKHKFVILLAIISSAICQYLHQPQLGTNYQTDNSARQETINANGEYEGQYSYQDPTGSRVVVKYNAGRNGFNVIGEDKIPQQQEQTYIPQQQEQTYIPQQQEQTYIQPQIPQSRYYQPQPQIQPQQYPRTQPRYEPEQYGQQNIEDLFKQFGQSSQQIYAAQQPQNLYQPEEYQPKFTKAVFTAAQNPYPAATAGQTKSYYEYLEEEQKEANAVSTEKSRGTATAHVSVKDSNQGYSYNIQL